MLKLKKLVILGWSVTLQKITGTSVIIERKYWIGKRCSLVNSKLILVKINIFKKLTKTSHVNKEFK